MRLGIDIRALQTGHKFRGIGEVAKQVTNRLLRYAANDDNEIIFYEYDDDDPKELLDLPKGLKYTVVKLGSMPENNLNRSRLDKIKSVTNQLYGLPISDSNKSDAFLQFDYAFGVPRNTRTVLIKHDLIPLIFWNDFFESPMVPFKNLAARTTLRTMFANYKYRRVLSRSVKNAHKIIAVSSSTKDDLKSYLSVPEKKIKVVYNGIDVKPTKTNDIISPDRMPTKPYILFVGAADQRRRVEDLVDAFNNIRADGHDMQLVLVGENFKSPELIPSVATRKAVMRSSYKSDILTMGYVDDTVKQRLFKDALVFVYPTKYEGFGIPVLEAFLLGTSVITYKNSSLSEVGGDYAIYVNDWWGIKMAIENLLKEDPAVRKKRLVESKKWAEKFSWDKSAEGIYKELVG